MLERIQKNKKQVENKKNLNIFSKSSFFILCNKKSESFQQSLIFEQQLKKEKNIKFKNFKKGSLVAMLKNTFLENVSKFFEGQLFLIWTDDLQNTDVSKIISIIDKTSSLNIITCKIGKTCYSSKSITKLSKSTLQNLQLDILINLTTLINKPFSNIQYIKNRPYSLLKQKIKN